MLRLHETVQLFLLIEICVQTVLLLKIRPEKNTFHLKDQEVTVAHYPQILSL